MLEERASDHESELKAVGPLLLNTYDMMIEKFLNRPPSLGLKVTH